MQTSRFQLGLIATLAVGLGYTLSSAQAVGYPAGAAVSYGANPVISRGGELSGTDSESPFSVSSDQSLVITDVILTASDEGASCQANTIVSIEAGSHVLARFSLGFTYDERSYTTNEPMVMAALSSGIHIPAGSTMTISSTPLYETYCFADSMEIEYTLSGYYAQP